MTEDELSHLIIGRAIEVHKILCGPGLLENVYEEALAWELEQMGLKVERQVSVPIRYKAQELGNPLFIDLLINQQVIIECKATADHNKLYEAQTLTYLRLMDLKLGLVINFGQRVVKDGIHRVVNGL